MFNEQDAQELIGDLKLEDLRGLDNPRLQQFVCRFIKSSCEEAPPEIRSDVISTCNSVLESFENDPADGSRLFDQILDVFISALDEGEVAQHLKLLK